LIEGIHFLGLQSSPDLVRLTSTNQLKHIDNASLSKVTLSENIVFKDFYTLSVNRFFNLNSKGKYP